MPPSGPDSALLLLDQQVASALSLSQLAKGKSSKAILVRSALVELSGLRIFGGWEGFLERCFVEFVMGEETSEGYAPESRYQPDSIESAVDLVSGPRGYFEWGNPDMVIERSKQLFGDDGLAFAKPLMDVKA